jgi:hypothetical protein
MLENGVLAGADAGHHVSFEGGIKFVKQRESGDKSVREAKGLACRLAHA